MPDQQLLRLQVISHPVRLEILELLVHTGDKTAAQIGALIPRVRGSVEHHLTQMERAQFVAHTDTPQGTVWRPDQVKVEWDDEMLAADPELALAAEVVDRVFTDRRIARIKDWAENRLTRFDRQWRDAALSSDSLLTMDASQLGSFTESFYEFLDGWRERLANEPNNGDTKTVFVMNQAFPLQEPDKQERTRRTRRSPKQ